MRCEHCGKEVKNNVIFCIHCGRPVKREYSHYACEFYDSLSFFDKIANIFSSFSHEKSEYRQDFSSRKSKARDLTLKETLKEKSSSIKNKGNSIKQLYDEYTKNNSQTTDQFENNEVNIDFYETETYVDNNESKELEKYNDQDPEYFNLKDLKNIKENTKKAIQDFSNSSEEEQSTKLKIIGFVVTIIVLFVSMFFTSTDSNDYNVDYIDYSDYEYNENYNFPEEPVVVAGLIDAITNCPLGNEDFIINYLKLLYEDTTYMQAFDAPLYSLEDFEPYISQIEQIEGDYENNDNYVAYDELIYINDLWQIQILPIYQNPENYEQWEINDNISDFYTELTDVCNYYLNNEI